MGRPRRYRPLYYASWKNVHEFTVCVTMAEKGAKEVNVAQIKEVMLVADRLLDGDLYKAIRKRRRM